MLNEIDPFQLGQQKMNGNLCQVERRLTMVDDTDPFWRGQQKINGNLCRVDWLIVAALNEASRLLKAAGADTGELNRLIAHVDRLSESVALETPPGCNPVDRRNSEGGGL